MSLHYDSTGLLQSRIGASAGLSTQDRASMRTMLDAAFASVLAAREQGGMGFMNAPDLDFSELTDWAEQKRSGIDDVVVVGIGGSSLGAKAVINALPAPDALPARLHFAENVDPVAFLRLIESIEPEKTLVVVISKSGTTIETMSKFWILYDQMIDELGEPAAADRVVAITDPETGSLRPMAEERGFDTFEVPRNVGGRFSVLTAVGMVPLALAGYDVDALQRGSRAVRDRILEVPAEENAALTAAGDLFLLYRAGIDQIVMMPYAEQLLDLADWFRQLWAESLGKAQNRDGDVVEEGMTPIKALGAIDQHSQVQLYMEGPRDKLVIFVDTEGFASDVKVPLRDGFPDALGHLQGRTLGEILSAELRGTRAALAEAGRPTCTWTFDEISEENVGAFIFGWEFITAIMGELLDIDAFNQPGVELGKKIAHGLLGRPGFEEYVDMENRGDGGEPDRVEGRIFRLK
ncbi:MAG: glucose-6-phosphate isomerase [Myxococcota bacterium]